MMGILGMVLPGWAKYAAIAVFLVVFGGFCWVQGNIHGTQKLLDYQSGQIREGERLAQVQRVVTEKVVTVYKDRVRTIKETADVIETKVPVYITVKDDAACHVNVGARVLHDAAASGQIPPPPTGNYGEDSGLTLSTTLGTVAQNYATFHQVAARLTACQDWIAKQYETMNKEKYPWPN